MSFLSKLEVLSTPHQYLTADLVLTEVRSERTTFSNALHQLADEISQYQAPIIPEERGKILEGMRDLMNRFNLVYSRQSLVTKIGFSILSPFGCSAEAGYNRLMDVVAQKLVASYEGDFHRMVEELSSSPQYLQEKVIDIAKKNLQDRSDCEGFLYEVVNSKGVISYLIGTMHTTSQTTAKTARFIETLKKSKELIIESDPQTYPPEYRKAYIQEGKRSHGVDRELVAVAKANKIPTTGLESFTETVKATMNAIDAENGGQAKQDPHAIFFEQEVLAAWQNGNAEQMVELSNNYRSKEHKRIMIVARNRIWLESSQLGASKGLITKLEQTDQPVCVAVGAYHLLGEKGLVEDLEKVPSLTVTRRI